MFYRPDRTLTTDEAAIKLMSELRFALLVSTENGELHFSHIPVLVDVEDGAVTHIRGHVARANAHWQSLERQSKAVMIFNGPNAYISAQWYTKDCPAAPTWSYAVVHIHGDVRLLDQAGLDRVVDDLVKINESVLPTQWSIAGYSPQRRAALMPHIVGFSMSVTRLEPKFNIKRHYSDADKRGAIAGLRSTGKDDARQIAELMAETLSEGGDRPASDILNGYSRS
ncbi:FMN-binding negative transcriptional regulator [Bradyrhizobium sp. LHD-71]|uniref:FMN-binding negative transcriptional regulator n=1 Tax=Bradyrhizobium sp. LHD-71 TaxID=3072141 RepID=UPI00280FAD5C|nr:FMN-binding negative transcriptional regulator [Bradyrhizobium sp. LHD-71]MDQ8726658.1 FMN-binding negative transcriptional regulator [Bradyrhizobium sp. LHD-71]